MKFLTSVILLIFATKSKASLYVEPYLGYQALTTNFTFGNGSAAGAGAAAAGALLDGQSLRLVNTGAVGGLRLGYKFTILYAALDYSTGTLNYTVTAPTVAGVSLSTSPGSAKHSMLGLTFGVALPLIRPYLGYIYDDQMVEGSSTTYGNGFKAGLGFSFLPIVEFALEYQAITHTKNTSSGTTVTYASDQVYKSAKSSGFQFTLSAPFSF